MSEHGGDHDLLVRIDERLAGMECSMKTFITRAEFNPVQKIAYGLVVLIVTAVVGSVVSLTLK